MAITPPQGCGIQSQVLAVPPAAHWPLHKRQTGIERQQQIDGASRQHSVVELALARLIDKAALMLWPPWTALTGAVLPLHHLGAQRVTLGPLSGPLLPPRLAGLLQQHCPRRQGSSSVVQGPGLAAGRCQLSVTMEGCRSKRASTPGHWDLYPVYPQPCLRLRSLLGSSLGTGKPFLRDSVPPLTQSVSAGPSQARAVGCGLQIQPRPLQGDPPNRPPATRTRLSPSKTPPIAPPPRRQDTPL